MMHKKDEEDYQKLISYQNLNLLNQDLPSVTLVIFEASWQRSHSSTYGSDVAFNDSTANDMHLHIGNLRFKFHFNVHPDDQQRAWDDVIVPIALKYKIRSFKLQRHKNCEYAYDINANKYAMLIENEKQIELQLEIEYEQFQQITIKISTLNKLIIDIEKNVSESPKKTQYLQQYTEKLTQLEDESEILKQTILKIKANLLLLTEEIQKTSLDLSNLNRYINGVFTTFYIIESEHELTNEMINALEFPTSFENIAKLPISQKCIERYECFICDVEHELTIRGIRPGKICQDERLLGRYTTMRHSGLTGYAYVVESGYNPDNVDDPFIHIDSIQHLSLLPRKRMFVTEKIPSTFAELKEMVIDSLKLSFINQNKYSKGENILESIKPFIKQLKTCNSEEEMLSILANMKTHCTNENQKFSSQTSIFSPPRGRGLLKNIKSAVVSAEKLIELYHTSSLERTKIIQQLLQPDVEISIIPPRIIFINGQILHDLNELNNTVEKCGINLNFYQCIQDTIQYGYGDKLSTIICNDILIKMGNTYNIGNRTTQLYISQLDDNHMLICQRFDIELIDQANQSVKRLVYDINITFDLNHELQVSPTLLEFNLDVRSLNDMHEDLQKVILDAVIDNNVIGRLPVTEEHRLDIK